MFETLRHVLAHAVPCTEEPRWARVRKPLRHCDEALTGTTRQWLRRLPGRRRPLRLCMDHPRVANRLAWCWRDPALSAQALDDLLVDKRGGRRGFAPAVVRELQRLREFNNQQYAETGPEGFWAALGRSLDAG